MAITGDGAAPGTEPTHLRQLQAFLAVAETLNIGRAAERLGTTQPPVSRLLLRLERRLGLALFERHSRGVSLTAAGAALLPAARRVQQALADLDHAVADVAAGSTGILRIGTTEGAAALLTATLRSFRRSRPQVEIRLHPAHTTVKLDMLRRGELDLAFVRNPPRTPGVHVLDLVREPLLAVVAADHPLADRPDVALSALADYPLLITPRSTNAGVHDAVMQALDQAGVTPRLGPPLLTEADGMAQVAASDQWTLLSADAAGTHGDTVALKALTGTPLFSVVTLAWPRRRGTPLVEDFVASARAAAAAGGLRTAR